MSTETRDGADHHLARVGFVIGAFIGDAQHGHVAKAGDGFGDQVEMLAGVQRQGDAGLARKLPAPHAAAVDHDIGCRIGHCPRDRRRIGDVGVGDIQTLYPQSTRLALGDNATAG